MPPRLGQHFLTDTRYLSRVADAAAIEPDDHVLEIGPGTGLLTRLLIERGARVVAIELDTTLADALPARLEDAGPGTLHVIRADAASAPWPRFEKLVSNLPYQISSPVLFRVLETEHALSVLTLQREFAERLAAAPDTRNYSRLTVKAALRARTERLFRIPPGAFQPPPKVDSACVRITPREPPEVLDWALFDALVDHAFTQRRKMLRASLKDEPDARAVLDALGWGERRPGELAPVEWVELANQVARVQGRQR